MRKGCCVPSHVLLDINMFSHPTRVGQFTHVIPYLELLLSLITVIRSTRFVLSILFGQVMLWKIPVRLMYQYVIEVTWFEIFVSRFCNFSTHFLRNVMVVSELVVVVDKCYSMFRHLLPGKQYACF